MVDITPVAPVAGATASAAPTDDPEGVLQQAFAQGVVQFMGIELQGIQSDIIEAINDNTSNPDAPS